ncbi:uncharacterized protein [Eurosta solidaginis]|uniref:uncharacterized protein n=1 Tax=Eurosta solidaginis TaxID=178769 RepID=UPI0035313912
MNIFGFSLIFTCFPLCAADENYCDPALCKNTGGEKHVACDNDGSFGPNCTQDAQIIEMTKEIIMIILDEHNKGRNALAGGEVEGFESALRMATMQWDEELHQLATFNVIKCECMTDGCRNTRPFKTVGQNSGYFGYTGKKSGFKDEDIIRNHTQSYFREHTLATMDDFRKYPNDVKQYGKYSHFALVSTERNNYVGCAALRHTKEGFNMFLFTCNYATAALSDWPIYKTGSPASECRKGTNPDYPNLCSTNEVYSSFIINGSNQGLVTNSETALTWVISQWKEDMRRKKTILVVLIDFKRAFETIDRNLMVKKLKRIGIEGIELKWFESFLTRKQYTVIDEAISDSVPINVGLPQGSVLAPILFNVYINDIASSIKNGKIKLFVDDALLTLSEENIGVAFEKMQEDLNSLYIWLCKNKLLVNVEKTNMVISTSNKLNLEPHTLNIKNETITEVKKSKYLGVVIDNKLKFCDNVDNVKATHLKMCKLFSSVAITLLALSAAKHYCDPKLCANSRGKKHIACDNDGSLGSDCPDNARLIDMKPIIPMILQIHNKGRNLLAGGEFTGYPNASRMATMLWEDELAQMAALNVKQCISKLDDCRNTHRFKYSGQNIYQVIYDGNVEALTNEDIIKNCITKWFAEYKWGTVDAFRKFPKHYFEPFGHFALLVIDDNNYVGCAAIRFTNEMFFHNVILTCNYAKNLITGISIYEEGPPTSDCRSGEDEEFSNLCSIEEIYD